MRAEDFRLAAAGEQGFSLRVDYIEELGSQRLIHGMIGDQNLTVAFPPEIDIPAVLLVTISPGKASLLFQRNGQRIGGNAKQVANQPAQLATV